LVSELTFSQEEIDPQRLIGDIIENLESDDAFEQNTILEYLTGLLRRPLNINKAESDDFADFILLSPIQVANLLSYRAQYGDLVSIYELQAVPGFDLETIRQELPFVRVNESPSQGLLGPSEILRGGDHTIFIGGNRTLEDKAGYLRDDGKGYVGNPWRQFARYRFSFGNRVSAGFTIESDSGEPFLSNGQLVDYKSAHFYMKDVTSKIKAVALGDYNISLGQGLTMFNGFSPGKSAYVMDFKRTGRKIRRHTSNEEVRYLRGAAATVSLSKDLELTGFVSSRNRDGNGVSLDTLDTIDQISSLQLSGLHRTQNEIDDKGSVHNFIYGGNLNYQSTKGQIGFNFYNSIFDKPLQRNPQLYNQFLWNGDQLGNYSIDYSYRVKALSFFGESAYSSNGGWAHTHSMQMGLSEFVSAALSYRNFDRKYTTLYPGAFAESQSVTNESGLYFALDIHPTYNWSITGYADLFQSPWLRFGVDGLSTGSEYLIRTTYRIKRKLEAYVQWREEAKQRNLSGNETPIDLLVPNERTNLRLHIGWKINPSLELRTRAEHVWWDEQQSEQDDQGFLIYQDILFRPQSLPFSFTARYAWFRTDGFDTRVYTYENDLIYNFSIPAFADHGARYYINMRYDINRSLTAEARIAQTAYRNRDAISSGNEEIEGSKRTDVKFQVRLRF